jgi:hypothetical protein
MQDVGAPSERVAWWLGQIRRMCEQDGARWPYASPSGDKRDEFRRNWCRTAPSPQTPAEPETA